MNSAIKKGAAEASTTNHQNDNKILRKYQEQIGMTVCVIGAMAGDSENLLIPLAIMALGILIIRKGAKDDSI